MNREKDFISEKQSDYFFFRQVVLDYRESHNVLHFVTTGEREAILKWAKKKLGQTIDTLREHDS